MTDDKDDQETKPKKGFKAFVEPLAKPIIKPIKGIVHKGHGDEVQEDNKKKKKETPEETGNVIPLENDDDFEDRQTLVVASKSWEIKMPPIKKHMVGNNLVPAPNFQVIQKQRLLKVEIRAPKPVAGSSSTKLPQEKKLTGLCNVHTLESNEYIAIKIYKDANKEPDPPQGVVEAVGNIGGAVGNVGAVVGNVGDRALSVMKIPSPKASPKHDVDRELEIPDWKEHAAYRLEDVAILQTLHHHTSAEVRLGSGHEKIIRDFIFSSQQEEEDFKATLEKAQELEHHRAKRQIAIYKEKRADISEINILVEIVSAQDLPVADVYSTDAYVICRMGNKEIHRTKVVSQELDPIWTLSTGSLFLISMTPEEFFSCSGGLAFILKDYDSLGANELLGRVTLTLEELLMEGTGERKEYNVVSTAEFKDASKKAKLALRWRDASPDDVEFMTIYRKKSRKKAVGVYSGETFLPPRPPDMKLFKRQNKGEIIEEDKEIYKEIKHRVKPYPDRTREHETKWMTSEQIEEDAYKQSTNWTEAGSGDVGKLYLEVIGCDKLPNADVMTLDVWDKTDAFVCLVFEDTIVNTDVIANSLSPRWPSWSRRAFVFNISHPCSDVLLGVFDYDPEKSPLQQVSRAASDLHDPIGRIRIDISNFAGRAVYTLKYNLYYGETAQDRVKPQGTVTIRLRLQWNSLRRAYISSMKPPPPQYVSLQKKIYFDVAHYTTEGLHDEQEFNMKVFTEYIKEAQSNKIVFEYVKEALVTLWLWRGNFPVKISGQEYSLPLHSITAFAWGILLSNNFNYFPSFLFFSVAWIMLACNEYTRQTPSPWHKTRSFVDIILGTAVRDIEPNQNLEEIEEYNAAIEKRNERREKRRELEAQHELELKKEIGDDANEAEASEDITTKKRNPVKYLMQVNVNPLKPVLYPIQLKLHKVVIGFRIGKGIVLWDDAYYSFWVVVSCLVASAVTFFVPWHFIFRWTFRALVWIFLGPWMAIVDRYYFRDKQGLTDEEKDAHMEEQLQAKYEAALKASTTYRVRKERAVKYKDLKDYMFGGYLVRVPRFMEDLYKDVPLPESSAKPYDASAAEKVVVTDRKYGQQLTGDMIPKREVQVSAMMSDSSAPTKTGFFGIKGFGDPEKVPLLGTALGPKNPLFNPATYGKKRQHDACSIEKKTS